MNSKNRPCNVFVLPVSNTHYTIHLRTKGLLFIYPCKRTCTNGKRPGKQTGWNFPTRSEKWWEGGGLCGWGMRRKLAVLIRRLVLSQKHERMPPETRSEFRNDFIAFALEFYPLHAVRLSRVSTTFAGETVRRIRQRFRVCWRPAIAIRDGYERHNVIKCRVHTRVHSHAKYVTLFARCIWIFLIQGNTL